MRLKELKKVKMRVPFGFILSAIVAIAVGVLQGCEKASHNEDLDGQWQVMDVTSGETHVIFPEGERFYYLFYLHTFQLGFTDKRPYGLVGNLSYDGSLVGLEFPLIKEGKVDRGWIKRMVFWGLPETGDAVLHINELNSKRLVMQRDSITIICRKF